MRGHNISKPGWYDYTYRGATQRFHAGASSRSILSKSDVVKNRVGSTLVVNWRNPSAYQMDSIEQVGPYGSAKGKRWNDEYKGHLEAISSGSYVPVGYEAPVNGLFLENQAILEAQERLKNQKVNLFVALAEMQQTANLIAQNANRIAKAYRFAKKKKWKRAFNALRHQPGKGWDKELSSRVLEFNYGVRPLLSDVYGAMSAQEINERAKKHNLIRVTGSAKDGSMSSGRVVQDRFVNTLHRDINYREEATTKVVMYYYPVNDFYKKLSEVGVTNPLTVIWEKVPFSFAIDWFLPVGGWLDSMDAAIGLHFLTGVISEWSECRSEYQTCLTDAGYFEVGGFRHCKRFRRRIMPHSPTVPFPVLKNPVSKQHALNAIALLGGMRP